MPATQLSTLNSHPPLFDSAFLAKLEQLFLLSRKLFRGQHRAERKSRQTGSSLEFADYRNYALGDDLRSIDWNIYGRLDRLVIKLFEQEQDLHIHLLIDASASMRWRSFDHSTLNSQHSTKLDQARRIAASLSYVGLANLDRINLHFFGANLLTDLGLTRGRSQFHRVLAFLRDAPDAPGETSLAASLRTFAQRTKRRGLAIVLSDFFDPHGYEEALALLRHQQFEIHAVQVLDPAEIRPTSTGDLRLLDAETGAAFEITANENLLRQYRAEIERFSTQLAAFCAGRGIAFVQALTSVPFEDLVLRVLREGRLLK